MRKKCANIANIRARPTTMFMYSVSAVSVYLTDAQLARVEKLRFSTYARCLKQIVVWESCSTASHMNLF